MINKRLNQRGFSAVEGLLVIIIILLVGFIGYYVWHAQQSTSKTLNTASTAKQATTTKSQTAAEAKDIKYDPIVVITTPADVDKLTGSPQSFKDFASGQIAAHANDNPANGCGAYGIGVSRVYKGEFALGTVGSKGCDGAEALWGRVQGKWQQIFAGQQLADCATIKKYKVPQAIYPECFDATANNIIANTN